MHQSNDLFIFLNSKYLILLNLNIRMAKKWQKKVKLKVLPPNFAKICRVPRTLSTNTSRSINIGIRRQVWFYYKTLDLGIKKLIGVFFYDIMVWFCATLFFVQKLLLMERNDVNYFSLEIYCKVANSYICDQSNHGLLNRWTDIFILPRSPWGGPFNPYNVTQTHSIFVKL